MAKPKAERRRYFTPPPAMAPYVRAPKSPPPMTDTERDWLNEMQELSILRYLATHYGTTIELQRERLRAWLRDAG